GYRDHDPAVRLGGVVLNRVGGDSHEVLLREALDAIGVPVLGALRRDEGLTWRDRHLGFVPAAEEPGRVGAALDALASAVEAGCDLEAIVALARRSPSLRVGGVHRGREGGRGRVRASAGAP